MSTSSSIQRMRANKEVLYPYAFTLKICWFNNQQKNANLKIREEKLCFPYLQQVRKSLSKRIWVLYQRARTKIQALPPANLRFSTFGIMFANDSRDA